MRKLFILVALTIPLSLMAKEVSDTTVVYNGKHIVISGDSVETRINVYTQDSTQLTKTSETKFVNKQEVERIYVSSPLFPTSSTHFYSSMYPTIWWSKLYLSTKLVGNDKLMSKEGIHVRDGYEVGVTTAECVSPINKQGDLVFSTAIQMVYSRQYFQNSALLGNDGHCIAFEDRTNAPASSNYMEFASMRLPFMLGWAPSVNWPTDWLDTQFGIGIVPQFRLGKADYMFEPEAFGDPITRKLKTYLFGLNLDFNMILGPVKLGGTIGLLPLFKTSEGKKAYYSSINFGINIGELFGKRSPYGSF